VQTTKPLRVLLTISNLEYGGAQRQVVELANAADPERMDLRICSLSSYVPLASELRNSRQRLYIIDKKFKFDFSVVARLALLLRRLRADVVHSFLFDAEIAVRLAGRLVGIPLIVGSERNTDYHLKRRQVEAYRLTRNFVDVIIANSTAGAIFNREALGQPISKYRVIHNGVNIERFIPRDRREMRRSLDIAPHEPVVGMFASFKAQKNHGMFFEAAQRILGRLPRTRFLLVGDQLYGGMHGSDKYKLQMMSDVERLGLKGSCVFLGNRDDVELLYPACDVTVLPSRFEGTPNVALESMACGVPVIATDVSDNRVVIPDGKVGFIVPLDDYDALADRICTLLTDHTLRAAMSAAAREFVTSDFSTERLAEKTEHVYREALL
jgi:glycosyltransferase involved in cell wall biosynthesis